VSLAGATPYEAFDNFRRLLQRAFRCVSREAHVWCLLGTNGYDPGQRHALAPHRGQPVKVLAGEQRLALASLFVYRVEEAEGERGPWKVGTAAYYHSLEDEDGREIVAYQWHPGQGSIDFPHLHIGTRIPAILGAAHKHPFPTGRVSLEDVLRLAIREFGVEPARDDWEEVLDETQATYEEWRTWP
jgi:hypothetical protein